MTEHYVVILLPLLKCISKSRMGNTIITEYNCQIEIHKQYQYEKPFRYRCPERVHVSYPVSTRIEII